MCIFLCDFRKIWIHIISIHMFIWIHICRIRTAYLWQITWIVLRDVFLASIFLAYVESKLFFSLSRGKIVWRQMVRSTHAVRKIRSIRNCMYGTYVGKQSSAQHRGRRAQKVHASVRKKIPLVPRYILQTYHEIWEHTWINRPFLANIWFQKGNI
jgi:hypothetical protein